jgi:sugar diacid utilization regulator
MSATAYSWAVELGATLGDELVLEDELTQVLVDLGQELACELSISSERPAPPFGSGDRRLVLDIAAGAEHFGFLEARREVEFDPTEAERLQLATVVIAVELVKHRTAREVVDRFEDDLLSDLIDGGYPIDEKIAARARKLGIDVGQRWAVLAMCTADHEVPESLLSAARRRASMSEKSLACVRAGTVVVALADDRGDLLQAKISDLTRVGAGMGLGLFVGVGSVSLDLARGLRQAEAALRLARQSAPPCTVHHDQLGTLRFLLDSPDASEMVNLVRQQLGELATADHARRGQLLDTLRALLEEGGNKPRTAARCHVHLSTLKYRLAQIAKITRRDLRDSQVRFEFMLAFQILDLLGAVGANPFDLRGSSDPATS